MRKQIFKIIFLLALFFITPGFVFAAPNVSDMSGNLIEGQNATINGSGFGIKNPAAPLYWNNFEAQNDGEAPTGWTGNLNGAIITSEDAHSGTKSIGSLITKDEWNQIRKDFGQSHDTWYVSAWFRLNKRDANMQFQWKNWRISSSPDAYHTSEEATTTQVAIGTFWSGIYPTYYDPANGKYGWFNNTPWITYNGGSYGAQLGVQNNAYPDFGQWFRLDTLAVRASGPSVGDGKYFIFRDGKLRNSTTSAITHDVDDGQWRYMIINNSFTSFKDVNSQSTSLADMTLYDDDLYIDSTRARLEICDSANFSNVQTNGAHCEIQIPTSWADDQVQFTVNKGSFSDEQAYLYVVDENGEVNADGYLINFSSAVDVTAPAAPQGLEVL